MLPIRWLEIVRVLFSVGRRRRPGRRGSVRRRGRTLCLRILERLEQRSAPGDITGIGTVFTAGLGTLPALEPLTAAMVDASPAQRSGGEEGRKLRGIPGRSVRSTQHGMLKLPLAIIQTSETPNLSTKTLRSPANLRREGILNIC